MSTKKNNIIIGCSLIIFCCVVWVLIPKLVKEPVFVITGFSASIFPKFSIILLLILSIMLVIASIKKKENTKSSNPEFENQSFSRVILGIIIIIAYLILFQYLGFILGSFLIMIFFMWFFRVKNIALLIIIPILTIFLVYLFFEIFLKVQLPDGIFIF